MLKRFCCGNRGIKVNIQNLGITCSSDDVDIGSRNLESTSKLNGQKYQKEGKRLGALEIMQRYEERVVRNEEGIR